MKKVLIISLLLFIGIGGFLYKYWPYQENVVLQQIDLNQIPNWNDIKSSDLQKSMFVLKKSCKVFFNSDKDKFIGNKHIDLHVKDFVPVCEKLNKLTTKDDIKKFIENNFSVYVYANRKPVKGLFTGYYMPEYEGSLHKTEKYNVPLYALPKDLVNVNLKLFKQEHKLSKLHGRVEKQSLIPYYTRKEINNGILKDTPIIAWLSDKIDRQLLEIEGSGIIKLNDKQKIYVGYDGENGRTYKSIASILIEKNILTKDTATHKNIRKYFKEHPEDLDKFLNENEAFVFFKKLGDQYAIGAQGVDLTPGFSLAVDPKWVPYGVPLILSTKYIDPTSDNLDKKSLNRIMIAQDTGGAITGPVRGDIFWGDDEKNIEVAKHMYSEGYCWLLLPKKHT